MAGKFSGRGFQANCERETVTGKIKSATKILKKFSLCEAPQNDAQRSEYIEPFFHPKSIPKTQEIPQPRQATLF